jgi:Tol biopolymer transport system component
LRKTLALASLVALTGIVAGSVPVLATPLGTNGRLAIRRYFNKNHTRGALFSVNPDGTNEVQITFPPKHVLDTEEDWSPDGTKLAFERHTSRPGSQSCEDELFVVNADGSAPHRVFPSPVAHCPGIESPAWSPDGSKIAFSLAQGPVTNDTAADVSIWTVNADGTGLTQITHPIGFQMSEDHSVQWSPDGTRLVIERQFAARNWRPAIFTVSATDGSDAVRISPWSINGMDHPDWSPDGQWLLFRAAPKDGSSAVDIAHPDGTGLQRILQGKPGGRSFLSSSFSPDGTAITIGIQPTPDANADVWIATFDAQHHIASMTNVTNSPTWESSTDWGTAPITP